MSYLPGDSDSGMFGGNSNWRGPVWMPVNMLLYSALLRMAAYYGDSFKVECPTGSGNEMTLFEVAHELAERLIATFQRNSEGRRPVFGGTEKFQTDPTGGIIFCSTSTSTATTARVSAPAIRRDGPV